MMSDTRKTVPDIAPDKSDAVAAAIAAGTPSYEAWAMSARELAKFAPAPEPTEEI